VPSAGQAISPGAKTFSRSGSRKKQAEDQQRYADDPGPDYHHAAQRGGYDAGCYKFYSFRRKSHVFLLRF